MNAAPALASRPSAGRPRHGAALIPHCGSTWSSASLPRLLQGAGAYRYCCGTICARGERACLHRRTQCRVRCGPVRHLGLLQGPRRLLAHELTHVVQQSGGESRTSAVVQRPQPARPRPVNTSNQFDLLNEIQIEINRSRPREARLTEAFTALEPSYAALVDLGGHRFRETRFPPASRRRRKTVEDTRDAKKGRRTGACSRGLRKGSSQAREWDYFIVRHGVTIDEIANYLSDDPKLPSILEARNAIPHDKVLAAGTLVYFQRDSFKRPSAKKQLSENLRSGSFIYPWGAFKVSHTEPRTVHREDVLLTKSEWESIRENELEQKHGAEAIEKIAAAEKADRAKRLKTDVKRAQKVPNAVLSFLFPTSRLYFKDQSSLINDPLLRFQYQTNLRGFDAGTNLYREAGAVAVAANLVPLAILEGYAAVGLLAEAGAGAKLAYGARYVYLNAPTLYGDAMFYGGASLSGAALGQHVLEVRSRGFESVGPPAARPRFGAVFWRLVRVAEHEAGHHADTARCAGPTAIGAHQLDCTPSASRSEVVTRLVSRGETDGGRRHCGAWQYRRGRQLRASNTRTGPERPACHDGGADQDNGPGDSTRPAECACHHDVSASRCECATDRDSANAPHSGTLSDAVARRGSANRRRTACQCGARRHSSRRDISATGCDCDGARGNQHHDVREGCRPGISGCRTRSGRGDRRAVQAQDRHGFGEPPA